MCQGPYSITNFVWLHDQSVVAWPHNRSIAESEEHIKSLADLATPGSREASQQNKVAISMDEADHEATPGQHQKFEKCPFLDFFASQSKPGIDGGIEQCREEHME